MQQVEFRLLTSAATASWQILESTLAVRSGVPEAALALYTND